MAYYRDRGDGLLEVVQDDGTVSPGLPPTMQGELEAQGILPERPEELGLGESGATASLFGGQGFTILDPSQAPPDDYGRNALRAAAGKPTVQGAQPQPQGSALFDPVAAEAARGLPRGAQQQQAAPPPPTNLVGGERSAPVGPDPRERTAAEVAAEMRRGSYYVAPREARDVLVGYTEQGRAPLPDEQLQQRRDNMAAQAAEQRWQGELVGERLEREQEARYVDIQQRFQQVERERALAERREANVARLRAEADQAKADIEQLNPRQLWDEMGGEQRFFAILSVALGGFAAGFTGSGRNPGLEMLQQAQRENLEAQKQKIAQQEGFYSEATAAYERALEAAGGDERAADLIYEIGMGRIMVDQARNYAMGLDSDIARSEVEQLAAQLEEQNLEKEAELQGLTRVRAAQFAHQEARAGGVVRPSYEQALERVGKRHELERKVGLRESDESLDRADLARRVVLPDGTAVYAKDQQTASDAQGVLNSVQRYEQLSKDAIGLLGEFGHSLPLSERRARLRAIGTHMALEVRNMAELGVISESDVEVFMKPLSSMGSEQMTSHDPTVKASLEQNMLINNRRRQQLLRQFARDPQMRAPVVPHDRLMGGAREGW